MNNVIVVLRLSLNSVNINQCIEITWVWARISQIRCNNATQWLSLSLSENVWMCVIVTQLHSKPLDFICECIFQHLNVCIGVAFCCHSLRRIRSTKTPKNECRRCQLNTIRMRCDLLYANLASPHDINCAFDFLSISLLLRSFTLFLSFFNFSSCSVVCVCVVCRQFTFKLRPYLCLW